MPLVAERRLLYGIRNTWFATKTESAVQKVRQTSVNPRGARRRWTYMPDGAFAAGWRLRVFRGGRTCTSRWNLRHAQMETLFLGKGIFPCRKKERKGLIRYSSRLHYDSHEMLQKLRGRRCTAQKDEIHFSSASNCNIVPRGRRTCSIHDRPRVSLAVARHNGHHDGDVVAFAFVWCAPGQ